MARKRIHFIGFGDIHGTEAYKCIRFGDITGPRASHKCVYLLIPRNPDRGPSVAILGQAISVHAKRLCICCSCLTMLLNYKRVALWKRTRRFGDVRVGAPLVAGLVVEAALKLAYAPRQGALPKVLERQSAADHLVLHVAHVFAEGQRPQAQDLQVPDVDAHLGITIARKVVAALEDKVGLTIIAVDHYNQKLPKQQAGWEFCHDIIGRGANTNLLDSVEIKVREVHERKPRTFNWLTTLESEAEDPWNAELRLDASPWRQRVLVFVELSKVQTRRLCFLRKASRCSQIFRGRQRTQGYRAGKARHLRGQTFQSPKRFSLIRFWLEELFDFLKRSGGGARPP